MCYTREKIASGYMISMFISTNEDISTPLGYKGQNELLNYFLKINPSLENTNFTLCTPKSVLYESSTVLILENYHPREKVVAAGAFLNAPSAGKSDSKTENSYEHLVIIRAPNQVG